MGNKSSTMSVKTGLFLGSFTQGAKNSLNVHPSEEDYLPMSESMRRKLTEGRKFRHTVPGRREDETLTERAIEREDSLAKRGSEMEEVVTEDKSKEREEDAECRKPAVNFIIEPVVEIVNMASIVRVSPSQEDDQTPLDISIAQKLHPDSPRIPRSLQPTNRTYSVVDIKTGLKKSDFTLELEEKLRQSKFELGLDSGLNDWKEFKYMVGKPEERKRAGSMERESARSRESGFGRMKELEEYQKRPLEICTHSCQILGLCSLGKNGGFNKNVACFDPLVIKGKTAWNNDFENFLDVSSTELKKMAGCNCDVCTLAYLTGMGFPEECEKLVEKRKVFEKNSKHDRGDWEERIKIIDLKTNRRPINVSVSKKHSTLGSRTPSTTVTAESTDADCTNLKIKMLFKKNEMRRTGEAPTNNNKKLTCNEVSCVTYATPDQVNVTSDDACGQKENKSVDRFRRKSRAPLTQRRPNGFRSIHKSDTRKSPSMGESVSSSLSSVLSYRRVRQIFQSFIERNCSRKRPRRNINKFREMEELGLGEVKNNRWYPSDSKTASIWKEMHSSVGGIQAEFRKYPKSSFMPLD